MAPRMSIAEMEAKIAEAKKQAAAAEKDLASTRDDLIGALEDLPEGNPEDVAEVRELLNDYLKIVRGKWAVEGKRLRISKKKDKAAAPAGKPEDGTAPAAPGATGGTQNSAKGGVGGSTTKQAVTA